MSEPNKTTATNDDRKTRRFPMLRGDCLPSGKSSAWIVQCVVDGWVSMISADMTATLRLPVDRFNWYWDQFDAAKKNEME